MRNSAMEHNMDFTQDGNARFSLLVALACVDNTLGEEERDKLQNLADKYGVNDATQKEIIDNYEEIIDNYERVLKHKSEIEKAKYVHEILTCVPQNDIYKLTDLRNCYEIITADNDVTEAEKNAFDIICRFYGVKKELFDNKNKKDYEIIFNYIDEEESKKANNNSEDAGNSPKSNIPNRLKKYLTKRDDNDDIIIESDTFHKIEEVFQYHIVRGPLLGGIKFALEKRYNKVTRNIKKSEEKGIVFAFVIFAFSAFTLLLNMYIHIEKQSETLSSLYENVAINDQCGSLEQKQEFNNASVLERLFDKIDNDTTLSFIEKKIYMSVAAIKNPKEYNEYLNEEFFSRDGRFIKFVNFDTTHSKAGYLIIALVVGGLVYKWRAKIRKNIFGIMLVCGGLLLAFSGKYANNFLLLYTMLSIEWLILMKGNSLESDKHQTLLAVLVVMAVVSDISYGMIELYQKYTLPNVLDKMFSALFLGCICFFTGKFLELQYKQRQKNKNDMGKVLDKIKKIKL